jgi:hypothetical protein
MGLGNEGSWVECERGRRGVRSAIVARGERCVIRVIDKR